MDLINQVTKAQEELDLRANKLSAPGSARCPTR